MAFLVSTEVNRCLIVSSKVPNLEGNASAQNSLYEIILEPFLQALTDEKWCQSGYPRRVRKYFCVFPKSVWSGGILRTSCRRARRVLSRQYGQRIPAPFFAGTLQF